MSSNVLSYWKCGLRKALIEVFLREIFLESDFWVYSDLTTNWFEERANTKRFSKCTFDDRAKSLVMSVGFSCSFKDSTDFFEFHLGQTALLSAS